MFEQLMGDFTHRDLIGISASSVIYKLREFSNDQPAPSLMFFHLQRYLDSLPYPKYMLRAHYISMSLATVKCEQGPRSRVKSGRADNSK